ncbi:hypothetical protein RZS08_06410, partial [Arthrospira platensis SPKY1]|nr:hypothetical protein [Arthrospira platensis SPKY1]
QFLLYTGWLPQFKKESKGFLYIKDWGSLVLPADLGYHSKKPKYEDHQSIDPSCEFCDGLPCFYEGSGLNANDAMYALVNGGDEALWEFLDSYYDCVFNDGKYPSPREYEKRIRP